MTLDDRARRAVDELREASLQARFTVRSPAHRSRLANEPKVAVVALVVLAAFVIPLLVLGRESAPVGSDVIGGSALAPTTLMGPTSPSDMKAPAGDVDELVRRLYAALNAKDNDAFRSLSAPGALHSVYYTDGTTGEITTTFAQEAYDLQGTTGSRYRSIEPGDPLVWGDAVAIPVAYTYDPGSVLTGFDLLVLDRSTGGLLIAGGVTIFGEAGVAPPSLGSAIAAEIAAWNTGDVDGVLSTMSDDAVLLMCGFSDRSVYHFSGSSVAANVATEPGLEIVGEPVLSGGFAALPARFGGAADARDGIMIYLLRDGLIALHAMAG